MNASNRLAQSDKLTVNYNSINPTSIDCLLADSNMKYYELELATSVLIFSRTAIEAGTLVTNGSEVLYMI